MIDVWNKASRLVSNGVPYVWIIDPNTLESESKSAAGGVLVMDKTLRVPDSAIVIPLLDVIEE